MNFEESIDVGVKLSLKVRASYERRAFLSIAMLSGLRSFFGRSCAIEDLRLIPEGGLRGHSAKPSDRVVESRVEQTIALENAYGNNTQSTELLS